MEFHVSLAGRGDRTARIYRELHEAIMDGRLRSGERLPPTRDLARQLDVSRNTVALAYERLTAEGFLVGRVVVVVVRVGDVGLGGGGLAPGSLGSVVVVFFFDVVVVVVVVPVVVVVVGGSDVVVGSVVDVSEVVSSTALRFSGFGVASSRVAVSEATVANTVDTTTSAAPSAM